MYLHHLRALQALHDIDGPLALADRLHVNRAAHQLLSLILIHGAAQQDLLKLLLLLRQTGIGETVSNFRLVFHL